MTAKPSSKPSTAKWPPKRFPKWSRRFRPAFWNRSKPDKAADIVEEMAPHDAADVLAELEEQTSEDILEEMEPEPKTEVQELLEYRETLGRRLDEHRISSRCPKMPRWPKPSLRCRSTKRSSRH